MLLNCNYIKYIIYLSILFLASCSKNDSKRDIIDFKKKTTDVRDSIIAMNSLMDQLDFPKDENRIKSWFFINDSIIDINGSEYNFNELETEHFTVLKPLASKDRFLNLVSYFRRNGLTSCRWDCSMLDNACDYYYSYKDIGNEASDHRDIALDSPIYFIKKGNEKPGFKILDHKFGLVLLALAER